MPHPEPNLKLVTVFESSDTVALSLAEAALREADIEFAVTEDALAGYGFSPMVNPVSTIQVAEPSKARAVALMQGIPGAAMPEEH